MNAHTNAHTNVPMRSAARLPGVWVAKTAHGDCFLFAAGDAAVAARAGEPVRRWFPPARGAALLVPRPRAFWSRRPRSRRPRRTPRRTRGPDDPDPHDQADDHGCAR
jgi:hypothetical protein